MKEVVQNNLRDKHIASITGMPSKVHKRPTHRVVKTSDYIKGRNFTAQEAADLLTVLERLKS